MVRVDVALHECYPDHRDVIVETLREAGGAAQAVFLFRARSRQDARADSDFDVALLVGRRLDPVRRWEVQEQLASRCTPTCSTARS